MQFEPLSRQEAFCGAEKGSHVNIKMPSGVIITIPAKGELKVGLLRAAIRKAGLTVEEFLRLLRG